MSYLALELVGKRIEFLEEWLPQTRRIAILARPQHPGEHLERKATEAVVANSESTFRIFHIITRLFHSRYRRLESVFRAIVQDRCDALVIFPIPPCTNQRPHCAVRVRSQAALRLRLVYIRPQGMLMTYGPNVRELYRSLARYTDRILRAPPPPSRRSRSDQFYLAINLRHGEGAWVDRAEIGC